MNANVKVLERIWREEGYKVIDTHATRKGGRLVEVDVIFGRVDREGVSLKEEWAKIERAAYRQKFYAIPVIDVIDRDVEHSRVRLIQKKGVVNAMNDWFELSKTVSQTYWAIQGEEETIKMLNEAQKLVGDLESIFIRIQNLYSGISPKGLFDDWQRYMANTRDFIAEIKGYEKTNEETKKIVERINKLYF